ncbi:hypothetical protein ACSNOI_02555 [Actinomadura kijaniata]|uniref:hypothetical protein n=1 Tax=Actinomadura kijaniata TaxID=46161 RepID=UPI003F1D625B
MLPHGTLPGGVVRALAVAVAFGAVCAAAGLLGVARGTHGGADLLAWPLAVAGPAFGGPALLLIALSRRHGRPATLTPDGIALPGGRLVPWREVETCEPRRGADGATLLAARTARHDGPLWLGALPPDPAAEHEIHQKIITWMRLSGHPGGPGKDPR